MFVYILEIPVLFHVELKTFTDDVKPIHFVISFDGNRLDESIKRKKKTNSTYRWWWKPSKLANCDALNWYNTTKNCISYRLAHLKSEFHRRHPSMRLLYLASDYRTVENNLIDMMNHPVLNYQVSRLLYLHYNITARERERENNWITWKIDFINKMVST